MNKFLTILVLLFVLPSYADYSARSVNNSQGIDTVVAIADPDTGYVMDVDVNGAIPVTISGSGMGAFMDEIPVVVVGTVAVTDNSTTLSVDDGAGSLTVDGTVAVSAVGGTVTANVTQVAKSAIAFTGNGTGASAVNAPATVYQVIVTAPTAGDYMCFYDATDATGTPLLDIMVGVNNSTVSVPFSQGLPFATEVYMKSTDTGVSATIIYE